MQQGLGSVVFDQGGIWGLNADFVQNMLAEGMGTILGVVISVIFAIWLDRQRENNRQREHRGRAVTRWVKNHTDMLDALISEMGHGAGERHRMARVEIVKDAERDAKDIKDDYASALAKGAVVDAFEDYVRELQGLASLVGSDQLVEESISARVKGGIEALKKLVQKAGARRSILQTEPIFDGTLPSLKPHGEG